MQLFFKVYNVINNYVEKKLEELRSKYLSYKLEILTFSLFCLHAFAICSI